MRAADDSNWMLNPNQAFDLAESLTSFFLQSGHVKFDTTSAQPGYFQQQSFSQSDQFGLTEDKISGSSSSPSFSSEQRSPPPSYQYVIGGTAAACSSSNSNSCVTSSSTSMLLSVAHHRLVCFYLLFLIDQYQLLLSLAVVSFANVFAAVEVACC